MRLLGLVGVAVLGLGACGGPEEARWVDLARVPALGAPPTGELAAGLRAERRGEDLWLVATLPRAAWSAHGAEAGRFRALLPVLAVGQPRAGGAPYRLVQAGAELAYAADLTRFGSEPGRFATQALDLLLALAPGAEPPAESELWSVLDCAAPGDAGSARVAGRRLSGTGFWVPGGHARSLALAVPPDSLLRFAIATEPLLGAREARLAAHTFRVRLDGAVLFERVLAGNVLGEALEWHALELPRGGVRRATLSFEVEGGLALSSFLAPRLAPRTGARGPRPDLLVFLADTFRADNLAAYGNTLGLTPAMDRFAAGGRTFLAAWSTSTHTLPAHSSLFSGVFPHQNGQVDFFHPLPGAVETLAEILSAQGYRCGAITDGVMVSRSHGLEQGFEYFDERREEDTVARTAAFLDGDDGRPLFLFVQSYAAHTPYASSAATRARLADKLRLEQDYAEVERRALALGFGPEQGPHDGPTQAVAADLFDLYRGAAAELDVLFGRFHAELERRGLLQRGVTILTSDHGEAFYEHGRPFHAGRVFEEELRVPLVLSGPLIAPGVETRPVSLIDFAPTLAQLAGVPPRPHWRGRSLLAPAEERVLYAFQANRAHPEPSTLAVIAQGRKLIAFDDLEAVRAGRLHAAFDLRADPHERASVLGAADWPQELERAQRAVLEELLTPLVAGGAASLTADKLAELRAMGYTGNEEGDGADDGAGDDARDEPVVAPDGAR